jgi:phosphoserine phosphatase
MATYKSPRSETVFFLKDLPTDKTLEEFAQRYPELEPSALKTCAVLLRTGSDLLVQPAGSPAPC